ncbi:MAG: hypothetical protein JSS27_01965 [Planctomycetes bacterium]|nr:hypothetical protein [Planctomycetota bacterium]
MVSHNHDSRLNQPCHLSIREIHHRADLIRDQWDSHELQVRHERALEAQARLIRMAISLDESACGR